MTLTHFKKVIKLKIVVFVMRGRKGVLIILSFLLAMQFVSSSLNVTLSDHGTDVKTKSTGAVLASGNLTIQIYDALSDGNLVYGETFLSAILNGSWNVVLGENSSNPLPLEFGKIYYKDYQINEQDLDFTNSTGDTVERFSFFSSLGDIGGEDISNTATLTVSSINTSSISHLSNVSFNGGWENGGVTIQGGFIYADTGFFYNISKLNLTSLNVNGSIIPQINYDNNFDLGAPTLRWRDLWLGRNANVSGNVTAAWFLGNINDSDVQNRFNYSSVSIPLINSVNTTANIQNLLNSTGIYSQSGNSFNQFLNTTSNVTHYNINISNILQFNASISGAPTGETFNGSVFYNNSLQGLMVYNGSQWLGITGVPQGTISAFNTASCPSGWSNTAVANDTLGNVPRLISKQTITANTSKIEVTGLDMARDGGYNVHVTLNNHGLGSNFVYTINFNGDFSNGSTGNYSGNQFNDIATTTGLYMNSSIILFAGAGSTHSLTFRIGNSSEGKQIAYGIGEVDTFKPGNRVPSGFQGSSFMVFRNSTENLINFTITSGIATGIEPGSSISVLTDGTTSLNKTFCEKIGQDSPSSQMLWGVSGSNVFLQDTTQNVGIGTTNPQQTLNVVGDLNVTGTSYLGNLILNADNITTNNVISKSGNITFWNLSNSEVMRITGGGRVGIGTTSPRINLELYGANVQEYLTDSLTGNSLVFQAGTGSGMKVTGWNYDTSTAIPLYLSIDGANTILNSGGGIVGIGTANPDSSVGLDVQEDLEVGTGTTGCVQDEDNTVLAGACVSDIRLKKDINLFNESVLNFYKNVNLKTFRWNKTLVSGTGDEVQLGFIAQDVEKYALRLVTTDEDGYKRVAFNEISLFNFQAIKEQRKIMEEMNETINKQSRLLNKICMNGPDLCL